ncbi:AAA family ATPase [Mycoplasma sp. Pen4]|uniref:ATP-dependent DNA helicase n=1 Tax=Mycoplasma sp. Pen4 TaxID=640330 RepID=UPI0016542394|nr:AAA family ATPase [Mycoplasma sp. Pen4]QNM93649.1 AAA family ATPase [Mycoplasma sp. Pen4]
MNTQQLKGKFVKLIKGSREDGWGFFLFRVDQQNGTMAIYCKGNVPELFQDYEIEVQESGRYKNNYLLVSLKPIIIEKKVDWATYFAKNIPHVGVLSGKKIADAFGKDVFQLIRDESNKDKLTSVMTELQYKAFIAFYNENKTTVDNITGGSNEKQNNLTWFYANNMSLLLDKLEKKHNTKDIDFVNYYKSNDPYELYVVNKIVELDEIDKFALEIGWDTNSISRFKAYLEFAFEDLENNNSTIILRKQIIDVVKGYFDIDLIKMEEYIDFLIKEKFLIQNIDDINNKYLSRMSTYKKEHYIASRLNAIQNKVSSLVLTSEKEKNLEPLSKEQRKAYDDFLTSNISLIIGGPGTGKTFLIQHIYKTLKLNDLKSEVDFAILAPTGRAATNVTTKIKHRVRTIHSFLQISKTTGQVSAERMEDLKDIKALVVDEFSMVDVNIFEKLLLCCPQLEKLIIIGDSKQLPAIGPGDLLNEIALSDNFPVNRLETFYRSESETIYNHFKNISEMQIPVFKPGEVDHKIYNNETLNNEISDLYKTTSSLHGLDDIILLAPTYKGENGLITLNNLIQQKINPKGKKVYAQKRFGVDVEYRIGDKVMQLENRLNDDICNGDIGYISDATFDASNKEQAKNIIVTFKRGEDWQKSITYDRSEFMKEITLSYGTTVHKFQGSEIPVVIFLVHPKHQIMLYKKLLYTATSRAIKNLIIVSPEGTNYSYITMQSGVFEKEILTNFKSLIKWG